MVRSLVEIVKEENFLESESMTTLLVVVPKIAHKDFLSSYERMAKHVVPMSAKLISSGIELSLFSVVVIKNSIDEFKSAARDKRLTVRDFFFSPGKAKEEEQQREREKGECDRLKGLLTNWVQINFAEAYSMMLHLKAIRVFVESVLRYGLSRSPSGGIGPSFQAVAILPKRGKAEGLRKALGSFCSASGSFVSESDSDMIVPGAGIGDFYPYVYLTIELEAPV